MDEVDYETGGDWPELAAGRGSSLELLHTDMDNRLSSAWAASDESNKSKPRTYTHKATYTEQLMLGDPSDFRELHFYPNASGHSILSDVELRKDGTGPNVLTNANKSSMTGKSDTGWLWQGNHWASKLDGNLLHIISEGHGDNRVNRVEIDTPMLTKSNAYELKFTARWVHGSHLLVAHTWDWSVAKVFQLDVPSNLGTPGKKNSRALPTPAAQAENLTHYPAVPRTTDTVKVTVRVTSATPGASATLYHRVPDANGKVPGRASPCSTPPPAETTSPGTASSAPCCRNTKPTSRSWNSTWRHAPPEAPAPSCHARDPTCPPSTSSTTRMSPATCAPSASSCLPSTRTPSRRATPTSTSSASRASRTATTT